MRQAKHAPVDIDVIMGGRRNDDLASVQVSSCQDKQIAGRYVLGHSDQINQIHAC